MTTHEWPPQKPYVLSDPTIFRLVTPLNHFRAQHRRIPQQRPRPRPTADPAWPKVKLRKGAVAWPCGVAPSPFAE